MMASLRDSEWPMSAIKLDIPQDDVFEFSDDLSAWSAASGIDPRLTIGGGRTSRPTCRLQSYTLLNWADRSSGNTRSGVSSSSID